MARSTTALERTDKSNEEVQSIFKMLKSGDENIKLSRYKSVVLILGNTGAGKSTLTHFIAGNNNDLISEEEYEGEFIIRDINERVSESTILSKTLYPDRIVDPLTRTIYYDCPGFIDTRSPAHDISATYFVKKVIDFASKVKLVFVVNYSSVRKGVDRNDFMLLVYHATTLLKNIEKFKDSIALIVTKVDNVYKNRGRYLVPDKTVIESIADFLQTVKQDIKSMAKSSVTSNKQQFYNNAMKFIDIILDSDGKNYNRIGLFRRPDESGPLSKIQLLQDEKSHIKNVITKNIIYTQKSGDDFGYAVSAQSLNYIHDLGDKINESIASELSKVGNDIKKYFENEEKHARDLNRLYDKFISGERILIQFEIKDVGKEQGFLKEIIKGINNLDIKISQDNILHIVNYLSYLKFLNDISKKSTINHLKWSLGLTEIKSYLSSSQKWYNFVINLYSWLSEYTIQQNITEYSSDANKLLKQCTIDKEKQIKVRDTDINLFLDKLKLNSQEHNIKKVYNDIKDLTVGHDKLEPLKRVLTLTLYNKGIETSCEERNKLVVKGQYIKLSDIKWDDKCPEKVEYVEIFGINKVFIDVDVNKTGENVQISLISPIWDIIGNRKIILDGKPGGIQEKAKQGDDGMPGLPGGAAGNFLGIAGKVIGGQLKITAFGGSGGPGQEGGDGADGRRGNDAPMAKEGAQLRTIFNQWGPEKEWKEETRWDSTKNEYIVYATYNYIAYGSKASKGGDGGNGGFGGKGGKKGKVKIFDLRDSGKISALTRDGVDGDHGRGGKGGAAAENGYTRYADCETIRPILFAITSCKKNTLEYAGHSLPGNSGQTGMNKLGRKDPDNALEYHKPSHSINSFKNYLRKNLPNTIHESLLIQFQNDFENNDGVANLYDTLGLVNELQGLENDYRNLDENMLVLPFYKSLLSRIHKYAMNPKKMERNKQYKKVLSYLYTATLSKLYCSGINVKNYMILDVPKYLDVVVDNIKTLKTVKNDVAINEHKKQYTNEINNQINNANDILNKKAVPEIKNILGELDKKIQVLINDTLNTIQETEAEKEEYYKKKEKLEQSIFLRALLYPINMVGDFLGFLGPAVEDIISVINGVDVIIDALNLGQPYSDQLNFEQILLTFSGLIEKTLGDVSGSAKDKAELLGSQLHDVGSILFKYLGIDTNQTPKLKDTYDQIEEIKEKLNKATVNNEIIDPDSVEIMRNEALEKLRIQNETLPDELKMISQFLNVSDISPNFYENIRNDNRQLQLVGETFNLLKQKLKKLHIFEKNIYNIIIPKCRELKNFLHDFKSDLTGKSHAQLDLQKWEIRKTIKDIKFEIEQLTKTFDIGEELTHCLDKLIEAMAYIINIYDLLEDYNDKVKLAAYIAHISSSTAMEIELTSSELGTAVKELELVIKSNLVLDEYNRAMEAFMQYIFPFAHLYLDKYSLPPSLGSGNETDYLLEKAMQKLKNLQASIEKSSISTNEYDEYIHKNINFNSENHHLSPFYVWEHSSNKNTIRKLLNGAEITIKSDIRNGNNNNAVKFNIIGINLKTKNETLQMELNRDLENFEVVMTHFGNSHFKCATKYYIINSDPLTFKYHFKKHDDLPIDRNVVYDKIMTNDYLLSPYALWSIRLHNETENFHSLRKYENEVINLELEGRGQYIDEGEESINICNKKIEEYYNVDETMSDMNSISDMVDDLDLGTISVEQWRKKRDVHYPPATNSANGSFKSSFLNNFFTSVIAGFSTLNYLNPINHVNYWIKGLCNGKEMTNVHEPHALNNYFIFQEQTSQYSNESPFPYESIDKSPLLSSSNILLCDLLIRMYNKNELKSIEQNYLDPVRNCQMSEFSHEMAYSHYAPHGRSKIGENI